MDRKTIILHHWDATYDQEGWYPPLKMALEGLNPEQANWKPAKSAHSVRELVSHLLYYKDRFLHRLKEKAFPSSAETNHDTFLAKRQKDEKDWNTLVSEMGDVHRRIREHLQVLNDSELDQPIPDQPVDAQAMSLILHDAYHTGQILLLRKLQHAWPEQRE